MFIDYLSHSPIWKESLVVIVEDDAQNGPDHVDAHRSTAYLAGGFVKQGFVDHTPYTTTGLTDYGTYPRPASHDSTMQRQHRSGDASTTLQIISHLIADRLW